jgi:phosphatidylglycerol:prolipoprotein diacylglycerol transferase
VISIALIENKLKDEPLLNKVFYKVAYISLFFAIIGARFWHVLTDFYLYQQDLMTALYIWNGGLSILGAVLGGVLGIVISIFFLPELKNQKFADHKNIFLKLLDYSIFGLPVGQAIGRFGNYFNQELYGVPTSGIFKIYIDVAHRLPGYEEFAYFHPLFFYEMLATGLFAVILSSLYRKNWPENITKIIPKILPKILPKIGTGKLFLFYALYYGVIRFFLDFLRIDRSKIFFGFLGTNQVILLVVMIVFAVLFFQRVRKK